MKIPNPRILHLLLGVAVSASKASDDCTSLANLAIDNTTVTAATLVPAAGLPDHCRVEGHVDTEIDPRPEADPMTKNTRSIHCVPLLALTEGGQYSRALELALDWTSMTASKVSDYRHQLSDGFYKYTDKVGSAPRLENGNTLVLCGVDFHPTTLKAKNPQTFTLVEADANPEAGAVAVLDMPVPGKSPLYRALPVIHSSAKYPGTESLGRPHLFRRAAHMPRLRQPRMARKRRFADVLPGALSPWISILERTGKLKKEIPVQGRC